MSRDIFSCIIYVMAKKDKKPTIPLPEVKGELITVAKPRTMEEIRANKKRIFLEYFADVPVQKIAASYIGVAEDTVIDWKKADSSFANQINFLQGEWIRKNVKEVKSREWLLERLFRQHFAERKELTGADGKDLPSPITIIDNVSGNNSVKKIEEPTEEN